MKAITIHPIWAWAIIHSHKRIENRCWQTPHRGLLAIHAGVSRKSEAEDRAFLEALGIVVPDELVTGKILGTVELVACTPYAGALVDNPWACGPVCWILRNAQPFARPIVARGQLRLWECKLPRSTKTTNR